MCNRTNREDALSPLGIEQVNNAMNDMMIKDINPSVVKYSLAAKNIDTANMIATEMQVRFMSMRYSIGSSRIILINFMPILN